MFTDPSGYAHERERSWWQDYCDRHNRQQAGGPHWISIPAGRYETPYWSQVNANQHLSDGNRSVFFDPSSSTGFRSRYGGHEVSWSEAHGAPSYNLTITINGTAAGIKNPDGSYDWKHTIEITFDIDLAVGELRRNAEQCSQSACGRFVRYAIEAGFGLRKDALKGKLTDPNGYAKTMGKYLEAMGFFPVNNQVYQRGDIAIIQNFEGGGPEGHAQMFDSIWISDFFQTDFWPNRGYRDNKPYFEIYRWIHQP